MILAKIGITIFFFNPAAGLFLFLVLIPAIIVRILIEEKTLFKIEGYSKFAKLKKRLIPIIWQK
jgi:protein-S-isoprenylcysteine O-methyltransferase Ste14